MNKLEKGKDLPELNCETSEKKRKSPSMYTIHFEILQIGIREFNYLNELYNTIHNHYQSMEL